jgi:glycosyltransferase involved in cell wall biosynthesis
LAWPLAGSRSGCACRIVVLEAMASGVPVIVSDRGGACELVQHGRTGLVAKGRSAKDLLAAIEHLLDQAELRRQMSSECRSYAETCGWENAYANFWNTRSGSDIGGASGAAAVVVPAAAGER